MLVPLTVGLSILRYRLWDIDIVINKSLVYGIFLGFALLLFTAVLAGLQITIGQSQPLPALAIAGLVSTVVFRPAQKYIQNFVDRRIYRFNFNLNELEQAQKEREITRPGILTGKSAGEFELGNLIGRGGMGEIYKGIGENQIVAIKTLLPELAQDHEILARFQREVQTGKRLKHRHIAEVFNSGMIDNIPYLTMEYIDGQDLRTILKRDGAFDEETTIQIIRDISSALDVAHAEGFVHRDLKPANIMLRENGEPVLMDFGITKSVEATSALTGTGAIGTIDYMAPEQIMSSRSVDHRADIYALGIVAFEMLTDEKPFNGSVAQIMFAHIQQPLPSACDINSDIPERIAEAIEKAMSKDPDKRFSSASDFAAAL
jgi:serine/threonine-protein kinase